MRKNHHPLSIVHEGTQPLMPSMQGWMAEWPSIPYKVKGVMVLKMEAERGWKVTVSKRQLSEVAKEHPIVANKVITII